MPRMTRHRCETHTHLHIDMSLTAQARGIKDFIEYIQVSNTSSSGIACLPS